MRDPYNEDLERNLANFQPLTPLTFLERAGQRYFPNTQRSFTVICATPMPLTRGRVSLPRP